MGGAAYTRRSARSLIRRYIAVRWANASSPIDVWRIRPSMVDHFYRALSFIRSIDARAPWGAFDLPDARAIESRTSKGKIKHLE